MKINQLINSQSVDAMRAALPLNVYQIYSVDFRLISLFSPTL